MARRCWRWRAAVADAVRDDWNGFAVLHTAASARRRPRSRPGAGRGRPRRRRHPGRRAEAGRSTRSICWPPTRSTLSEARQGLRDLSGPSRRCRRPSRRRDPAGRRLHREARHLRQHRGPRAARLPRRLSAGRCPRGLGDPARPVGAAGQDAAVRHARPGAGAPDRGEPRASPRSISSRPARGASSARRAPFPTRRSTRRSRTST